MYRCNNAGNRSVDIASDRPTATFRSSARGGGIFACPYDKALPCPAVARDMPDGHLRPGAASSSGAIQQYDDLKIGYDTNDDGDIADAGDEIQIYDRQDSGSISVSYDDNGNLTNDGLHAYVCLP